MKSKRAKEQRAHTKQRMLERIGIPVGDRTLEQTIKLIQTGQARFDKRISNRLTSWDVTIHDILVRVYYDTNTKEITTIFRPGDNDITDLF